MGPGSSTSTNSVITLPLATSTGWPVKKQTARCRKFRKRLGLRRLTSACSESETKRVRSEAMIADMMSSDIGPPMRIGAPLGTASTTDDGRRSGSEQLSAMSPSRTALEPMTVTVLDPNTTTASFSGLTGRPGVGVSPGWITGLGVLGNGAHAVPGGKRMWPGTCLASVPVLVAGKAVQ